MSFWRVYIIHIVNYDFVIVYIVVLILLSYIIITIISIVLLLYISILHALSCIRSYSTMHFTCNCIRRYHILYSPPWKYWNRALWKSRRIKILVSRLMDTCLIFHQEEIHYYHVLQIPPSTSTMYVTFN